jgi:hypothetical protein
VGSKLLIERPPLVGLLLRHSLVLACERILQLKTSLLTAKSASLNIAQLVHEGEKKVLLFREKFED